MMYLLLWGRWSKVRKDPLRYTNEQIQQRKMFGSHKEGQEEQTIVLLHSPTTLVLPELNLRVVHCVLEVSVDLVVQCLFSVLPSLGKLI